VVAASVHVKIELAPKNEKQRGAICENVLEGIVETRKRRRMRARRRGAREDMDGYEIVSIESTA
jgi:hypothetical protein